MLLARPVAATKWAEPAACFAFFFAFFAPSRESILPSRLPGNRRQGSSGFPCTGALLSLIRQQALARRVPLLFPHPRPYRRRTSAIHRTLSAA